MESEVERDGGEELRFWSKADTVLYPSSAI